MSWLLQEEEGYEEEPELSEDTRIPDEYLAEQHDLPAQRYSCDVLGADEEDSRR